VSARVPPRLFEAAAGVLKGTPMGGALSGALSSAWGVFEKVKPKK
jgi:hypothetical protein